MAKKKVYKLKSKVWLYPGDAAWHFLTVEKAAATRIKSDFGSVTRGFGSLPVEVTLGKSVWKTSVFPDKQSGTYLLPLKAKVRTAEEVGDGDVVSFAIKMLV